MINVQKSNAGTSSSSK